MNREFNPPAEMLRRLAYVIYLALLASTAVSGIIALAQPKSGQLIIATLLALLAVALKRFGRRQLHFERLFNSFPYGNPADTISPEFQLELEKLFKESSAPDLTWQERQKIRARLAALVELEPRLLAMDQAKILAIHPSLAAKIKRFSE